MRQLLLLLLFAIASPAAAQPPATSPAPGSDVLPIPNLPPLEDPTPGDVRRVDPLPYEEYRNGAFRAAQWAFRTEAAAALDQVAARFAAGDERLKLLEMELQQHARELKAAEAALSAALRKPDSERSVQAERLAARARAQEARQRIGAKTAEIEAAYPAYAELVRPQAQDLEAVQSLLRPDEALLLIVTAETASYIFAVNHQSYQWYRSTDLPKAAVDEAVDRLRRNLSPLAARRFFLDEGEGGSGAAEFDRAVAHRLYRGLIQPAEEIIGDRRYLMTVTSGKLATLPLGVLVTAPPPPGAANDPASLRATKWLADRHVLATLPAVSSLMALRCLLVAPSARHPGCPSNLPSDPGRGAAAAPTLTLAGAGAPVLTGDPGARRDATVDAAFRGQALADPEYLRKLPRLPGTLAELQDLGGRFPGQSSLLVGAAATEAAVKSHSQFGSARYVVFATHGLLAGQAGVRGEPGLVFTPPRRASALDDGFLSASEITQMRFAAEFVVLSACNTAAAGGESGGEGLSGLARAFFFAGARSVLVSHWEVSDQATRMLMTSAFASLDAAGDASGRGDALQKAAMTVRADGRFAEPRYWSAFVLVGDPR